MTTDEKLWLKRDARLAGRPRQLFQLVDRERDGDAPLAGVEDRAAAHARSAVAHGATLDSCGTISD